MPSLGQRTVRNAMYNTLSYIVPIIATFILTPLLIHELGVVEYGLFVLTSVVANFFSLLRFGLGYSITTAVARRGTITKEELSAVLQSSMTIFVIVGLFGALASALIGVFGLGLFHVPAETLQTAKLAFVFAGISFFFTSVNSLFSNTLAGLQRLDVQSLIYLGGMLGMNIALIIAAALGAPLHILALIQLLTQAALFLVYRSIVAGLLPAQSLAPRYQHQLFKPYIHSNVYAYIHELGSTLLTQFDKVLLGVFSGTAIVSYYNIAGAAGEKVQGLTASLTSIFIPVAAQLEAEGELERLTSAYRRTMRLVSVLALGLALTLVLFGKPLLRYWVGEEFVTASLTALYILAATYFVLAITSTAGHFALGLRQPKLVAQVSVAMAALNIALLFALAPRYGVTGAAVAYLLGVIPFPYLLMRNEQLLKRRDGWQTYGALFLKLAGTGVLYALIAAFVIAPWAQSLALALILGGLSFILYLVLCVVFGLIPRADRDLILNGLRRRFLKIA